MHKQPQHADDDVTDVQEEEDIHDYCLVTSGERALVAHKTNQEHDFIQQLWENKNTDNVTSLSVFSILAITTQAFNSHDKCKLDCTKQCLMLTWESLKVEEAVEISRCLKSFESLNGWI